MNNIERLVDMIKADNGNVGVLSCGEKIIVALLFNRLDWLPESYKHHLDAIGRLGDNCLYKVIEYHRRHS